MFGAFAVLIETIAPIAIDARLNGIMPIIRVGWNHPDLIKRAYDIGASGVMIPQVDTAMKLKKLLNTLGTLLLAKEV